MQNVSMIQRKLMSIFIFAELFIILPLTVSANVLEEITVTAQKREQSLRDVGIAMTAFTGEQIDNLGFESSTDIVAMSPGVYVSADTGGTNRKFTIRGVTQNDFLDSSEAPVAVYIDEGYVSTQQGQVFGLFDLERVEVLKGPQGTLFGRNATGGLVHYISRKPNFDGAEGYGEVTYGSYDQLRLKGAVGGPISENFAGRVAFMYNDHDGVMENNFPTGAVSLNPNPGTRADLGDDNTWGARIHTLFKAGEDLEILLSGYGSETETAPGGYEQGTVIAVFDEVGRHVNTLETLLTETREAIGPGGVALPIVGLDEPPLLEDATRPVPGGDLFGYRDNDRGDFKTSNDLAFKDANRYKTYGITGKITWDISDSLTLTSVTDYKSYDKRAMLDADAGPVSHFNFMAEAETDTIAQEIRLNGTAGRYRWVAGAYYLNIENDTLQALFFLDDSFLTFNPIPFGLDPNPADAVPGPGVDFVTAVTLETESYSIFGQIDNDLSDTFTLIAGLRAIFEDKEFTVAQNAFANTNDLRIDTNIFGFPANLNPGANPFADETSDTLWTGKIQLDWKPDDNWLIYFGINRGVKAGNFNGPLADGSMIAAADIPFKEEVLLAFEGGFKTSFWDDSVRLNGSVYHYDYSDYQAFTFQNVSGVITNEDAKMTGFELDLVATPTNNLDLALGFSYVDASVKDVEVAPGLFRDVEPTFTPEVQVNGLVRYSWPFVNGSEVALQLDANYVSDRWANLRNFDAHKIGSDIVGNARLFWYSPNRKWEASVFVTNIGDAKVLTERFDLATLCGCEDLHYAKPRWAGGSIRFNY